jgi:hypothetical protein
MPIIDSAYTDADMILGLYADPSNEILLAEYILRTGGIQLGFQPAGAGAFGGTGDVGDPGVTGTGGGPCFTAETRVQMHNGAIYDLAFLYEQRADFIGKFVKSFDKNNNLRFGKILSIFKSTIYEILEVRFEGEPNTMRMQQMHRFFTEGREFAPMKRLNKGSRVRNHFTRWGLSTIYSKELRQVPDGIEVFNMTIDRFENYFAFVEGGQPKAVHNAKPLEPLS